MFNLLRNSELVNIGDQLVEVASEAGEVISPDYSQSLDQIIDLLQTQNSLLSTVLEYITSFHQSFLNAISGLADLISAFSPYLLLILISILLSFLFRLFWR